LISCFPGMLLRYFLNDFEIVPVATIITGITLLLHCTRALFLLFLFYFIISTVSYLIAFLSLELATSIKKYFPFSILRIIYCYHYHHVVVVVVVTRREKFSIEYEFLLAAV
jgi:hypothetical protein